MVIGRLTKMAHLIPSREMGAGVAVWVFWPPRILWQLISELKILVINGHCTSSAGAFQAYFTSSPLSILTGAVEGSPVKEAYLNM